MASSQRTLPVLSRPARGKPPRHLVDMDLAAAKERVVELGQPAYRAGQLTRHYFSHLTRQPGDMTDLPAGVGKLLADELLPELISEIHSIDADRGATRKTLWRLFDAARIESVAMAYADRTTVCISSQAGCGMACPFCATGQLGLTRNLSTGEILEQVRLTARAVREGRLTDGHGGPAARLSNVVFMGMGEPLANYNAVLRAVRALVAGEPSGFGLSARHVTVSTCGLVPGIDRLAGEGLPVTLALSLHAPDDEARDELVPINQRWPVAEVLDAARRYFDTTGRRVSIEYALIRDVNDQAWRADLLGRELAARGSGWVHVNPIPLNPTPGSKWTASRPSDENAFVAALRSHHITTTIRDTRGSDIDGACGQLAAEEM